MNELQLHTLLEQAFAFQDSDKPLHAIQLLNQVIAANPACDRAYVMLAQVYAEINNFVQAERVLLQGRAAGGAYQEYDLLVGNLLLRQMKFEEAIPYFEKMADRKMPQVHLNLGLAYMALGRYAEAEKEMQRAITLAPNLPKVHELWGELLLGQERVSEAVEVLLRAVAIDQYSAAGYRLLGEAYARLSRWQQAYEHLVIAVDLDPDDAEAWSLCGDVLLHLNSFSEAKKYLQRSLQLKPGNPGARASYDKACAMLSDQHAG